MTSFIGRRREIDEARARLQQSRLVTLVGPGGVGKTRLAEEVSTRSARAFRDGTRWIDLASVRDPDALPSAAAAAVGVTDQSNRPMVEKIRDHLRSRNMMIVLDNCEHLLDASAAFVLNLLADDPEIRVLATSRERLAVPGEVIFELPPLSTPGPSATYRADELRTFESVALLLERARAVVGELEVTDHNASAIAQLCIQLDGIPLAIELAAVRLRSLSPDQLVRRLDNRFALLNVGNRTDLPRQQTLRALIDWSYDLCSTPERTLWARLSVFPGSFDLEAAEAVCADPTDTVPQAVDVLHVLDQLIAKSLLSVDRSGASPRFTQLMTVREYGQELMHDTGDQDSVYRRHRNHYLERSERYAREWLSPRQSELLAQWRIDHANVMAALDWSLRERALDEAARLAVALRYHWIAGGNLATGRLRLERLLDRLEGRRRERGNVLWVAAWTALIQGDHDGAQKHLDECADIAGRLGDRRLQANHDHWAALHLLFTGKTADAIALFDDAIAVHRATDDPAAMLTAQFQLAMAQAYDGRSDAALATSADVIRVADQHGEQWNKAYALWVASIAHYHRGSPASATDHARQALDIQREFKDKICTALSIEMLAWVAEAEKKVQRSAQLMQAARAVWQRLGTSVAAFGPHIAADSAGAAQRLESVLTASALEELRSPSPSMTIDEAMDLALDNPDANVDDAPRSAADNPLTRREQEVAELIAQGLSNRVVADKLVLSRRTIDGHVERILNKLGLRSRTQVALWLQARRP
ncbi:ATP-binding protein [Rhodococcoides corynebacterioides]|uniref:ATP-binding protein n=1 Tax=Rhodococcoides corynebacterioides TaxID=53972 RepID=UPI003F7D351B